jgi:hypothetical protein
MSPANFRHIGGAVIADHGRVTLAAARALAFFYTREAGSQTPGVSGECRRRAQALEGAVAAASTWRRAAGWSDPDLADRPPPLD